MRISKYFRFTGVDENTARNILLSAEIIARRAGGEVVLCGDEEEGCEEDGDEPSLFNLRCEPYGEFLSNHRDEEITQEVLLEFGQWVDGNCRKGKIPKEDSITPKPFTDRQTEIIRQIESLARDAWKEGLRIVLDGSDPFSESLRVVNIDGLEDVGQDEHPVGDGRKEIDLRESEGCHLLEFLDIVYDSNFDGVFARPVDAASGEQ